MDSAKRKALRNAYQSKPVTGGVYCVQCSGNNRKWIKPSLNMEGSRNRFQFSISIKSCPEPSMRQEWAAYGLESFSFSCLEELEKGEDQTDEAFAADIKALHEMWLEKLAQEDAK